MNYSDATKKKIAEKLNLKGESSVVGPAVIPPGIPDIILKVRGDIDPELLQAAKEILEAL